MRLTVERLETRDTPATLWADISESYAPGTFDRWVPDPGGVPWYASIVELTPGAFHQVVYSGDGGGARVVVIDERGLDPIMDKVFFDPDTWRSGVGEVTSIGDTLYVTPGVGAQLPGPVYGKIDLSSGDVSYHAIPGFDPAWRGGTKVAVVDVEWVPGFPGGNSPDPEKELVFLPGGTERVVPGNVFFVVNSGDDSLSAAVQFGDQKTRQRWEFAPAMIGIQFSDHTIGMTLQPFGTRTIDGFASGSLNVRWDGSIAPLSDVSPFVLSEE